MSDQSSCHRRFYYPGVVDYEFGKMLQLPGNESHHLLHVLRCRVGDRLVLFDSSGRGYTAELAGDVDGKAVVRLTEALSFREQGGLVIQMTVAVLKRRTMDWMIEKLSELGVNTLAPLLTQRCVGRNDILASDPPPQRWERLAVAAAKQCGRNRPMKILPPERFDQWHPHVEQRFFRAFAHPVKDALPLTEWLVNCPAEATVVELAIGPEGGFTNEEAALLKEAGYQPVALGGLILRAETASIAAAATARMILDSRFPPDSQSGMS